MQLRELDANLVVVFDALLIDASVTKAAARLGRSPSAVSHALAHLREIFADSLFVRAGQRLVPTAKAQELAPTVHIIVSGMESLLRPTEPFDPAAQERTFMLSCQDVWELSLLYDLREALKIKSPGMQVLWQGVDGNRYVDELRSGAVNFVVLDYCPDENIGDICWQMVGSERYVTLAREGHGLARRKIKKRDYCEVPHILVRLEGENEDGVARHFAQHGVTPADCNYVSSCFSGVLLARQSEGLIMVPESIALSIGASLGLERVMEPFPLFQVDHYLVWHKAQDRDECHNWLRGEIMEIWAGLVDAAAKRGRKHKIV